MNQIEIGRFISHLRRERKLTQKEIADKLGVTYQAVSKWERGENLPDVLTLKKLADIYEVSVDYIINSGEEKNASMDNSIKFMHTQNLNTKEPSLFKKIFKALEVSLLGLIPVAFMYFTGTGSKKTIVFFSLASLFMFVTSLADD